MSSIAIAGLITAIAGTIASATGMGVSMAQQQQADRTQATNIRRQRMLAQEQRDSAMRRSRMLSEQKGQDEALRAKQQELTDQQLSEASRQAYEKRQADEQARLGDVLSGSTPATPNQPAPANAALENIQGGDQSGSAAMVLDTASPTTQNDSANIASLFQGQTDQALQGAAANQSFDFSMGGLGRDLQRKNDAIQFTAGLRKQGRDRLTLTEQLMNSANQAQGAAIGTLGDKNYVLDNSMGNILSGLGNMALQYGAYGMGRGGPTVTPPDPNMVLNGNGTFGP